MRLQLAWEEIHDHFYAQGEEYELEKGWMTIEEGKRKVLANLDKAIGICVQPGSGNDPQAKCCIAVVKVGAQMYGSPGSGWTCHVYKIPRLPSSSDPSVYRDDFSGPGCPGTEGMSWARPGRGDGLADGYRNLCLFKTVHPDDLKQGALGDCWLASAFAAMAEFPDAVRSLFDKKHISPDGKYTITLYSFERKAMVPIQIDDRLPCEQGRCAFTHVTYSGEIWPCLLEKAFAKLSNGYGNLEGGTPNFAFGALTGCTNLLNIQRHSDGWWMSSPRWDTDNVSEVKLGGVNEIKTDEEMLDLLADFDTKNYMMCCSSVEGSDSDTNSDGVVEGHAYSLLAVKRCVADYDIHLLLLRNPWGEKEWTGPWSDFAPEWDAYPEIGRELVHEDMEDGCFWIDWQDFCENYHAIYVCQREMPLNRSKHATVDFRPAQHRGHRSTGSLLPGQPQEKVRRGAAYPQPRVSPGLKRSRQENSWLGRLFPALFDVGCCSNVEVRRPTAYC
mmetsp:Transcript_28717/g.60969  ORF Transcript_28717/g.60969 Transcript_28717/m.60969 type:complete len:500 (+) Transcript_28717:88-1587(+)